MAASVEDLHSLGPVTAKRLAEVGIADAETLRKTGAVAAYKKLKFRFGRDVTLNALYGLDAAIRNVHWREIDDARKAASPARGRRLGAARLRRAPDHILEHRRRQHARVRVVPRAVVAVEQRACRCPADARRRARTGCAERFSPSAGSSESCAIRPEREVDPRRRVRDRGQGRGTAGRSGSPAGVGLFCGGTQRTALTISTPLSVSAVVRALLVVAGRRART